MFLSQVYSLLQAMRCQTSPQYPAMRYGKPDKHVAINFASDGGMLYHLSSALLFWQTEADSCLAVSMVPSKQEPLHLKGSLSLLWPIFQTLCLSHFVETLSCAVQGRPVMTETGMSIFEHSLAFAEAEAMVNNQLGLSPFGIPKPSLPKQGDITQGIPDAARLVTKSFLFDRLNTPPEVLLMALISCLDNLCSQVLGVFGLQGRYRLINTGIWGLCFMASFIWGFASFSVESGVDAGILRFPTVCIVGFIPHLLILVGILMCAGIYVVALILSTLSPPVELPTPRTLKERLRMAHDNLQVNIQLSTIQVSMHEDFYTALLKVGFAALTAASEAVYLNEGRRIGVARWTWLEEERIKEIEQSQATPGAAQSAFSQQVASGGSESVASGVTFMEERDTHPLVGPRRWKSGYSRERTTKVLKGRPRSGNARRGADGVGALQRGGRYIMAWDFLTGIFWLVTGWLALGLIKILDKIGIARRPAWLRRIPVNSDVSKDPERPKRTPQPDSLEFWLLSDEGVLSLPDDDNVDVEVETKRRLRIASDGWGDDEEQKLDTTLYGWWKNGGWWGDRDDSGEYQATEKDDDTTSVISISTTNSENEWESDNSGSGRRTPTQGAPHPISREPSPVMDLSIEPSQLARLLDPKDSEDRQEARILAHHLNSDRIVTRSQYRHAHNFDKAHVLTSTRYRPAGFKPTSPTGKLTPYEEAELLEHLILTRRAHHHAATPSTNAADDDASSPSWRDGAEGLGAGGPQCVVCQSSPRTILAWPCRCLSLCEDCRVSLAMNNFATCVCCRQDVVGFSRLFVP